MATHGWQAAGTVESQLYTDGPGFDFYQAVRLLEWLHVDQDVLGETAETARESVRFRSAVGFDFPATDIAGIDFGPRLFSLPDSLAADLDGGKVSSRWPAAFAGHGIPFAPEETRVQVLRRGTLWKLTDRTHYHPYFVARQENRLHVYDGQAAMLVNFMGLAGVHGPLPPPITRLLLDRKREGDTVLRDFLDIFNHRLVSLMYRVRKRHRLGLAYVAPGSERDPFAQYLYALIGLGTPGLRHRMSIPDRALLRYAGLLAQFRRSAVGLEALLGDYFNIPVRVVQFRGRGLPHPAHEQTRLGLSGHNQALGHIFILGGCLQYRHDRFELHLGPLDLKTYRDFLPDADGPSSFRPLVELTQFYVRKEFDFDINLSLHGSQVPEWRLGDEDGARLGWTSWLRTVPFAEEETEVRVGLTRVSYGAVRG